MSYIKKADQKVLDAQLEKVEVSDSGALQFAITRLVLKFLSAGTDGALDATLRPRIHLAVGILATTQQELHRKVVMPYEQGEQLKHGDLYQEFVRKANLRTL